MTEHLQPKVWHTIKTLDGRTLSRTHGLKPEDKWDWIVRTVMHSTECDYEEEVDIEETEDGDIITVRGAHYAKVSREIV